MSQAGRALHLVNKNQFLDSPEWFGVTTDEYFQVNIYRHQATLIMIQLLFLGERHSPGAGDSADLASRSGQVLSDGGRQAPGHLRSCRGEGRGEEADAG